MPSILELQLDEKEARELPPLTLAYMGDTVFDLYVRKMLITGRNGDSGAMHRRSAALVNARTQAQLARDLMEELEGTELDVFMRGRNAKTNTVPKNMSPADYHHATAIEALIGYLYLTGQIERVEELLGRLEDAAVRAEEKALG